MTEPIQLNMLADIPPVFACEIDESAGQRDDHENTQLTELPGDTWEDLFMRRPRAHLEPVTRRENLSRGRIARGVA